jgi:diguanylate cyclase (GGDEF)-like protein
LFHHEQFHEVRAAVFDQLARERVATIKAEFELQRVMQAREFERLRNRELTAAYAKLEERANTLSTLSIRDGLTGLFNRRHFDEALGLELTRAHSFDQPLSLALLDIDYFKRINDTHSHVVGDEVLRLVASILQRELRASDLAARYGGEEFALVLPHTSLEGARIAAEKVRVAIGTTDWAKLTPGHNVTASLGLAQWKPNETPVEFVRRADEGLYAAKKAGRNRVRTS